MSALATALLALALAGLLCYRGEFGYQLTALGAAVIALHLWLLWSLQLAWHRGRAIPLGGIGAALLLWWVWLALTLYGHPVPYTGRSGFWVLGCAPLAFLALVAAPDRERLWSRGFGAVAALCTGLAGWGVWQHAVLGVQPTSIFLDANSHASLLNLVALPLAGAFVAGDGPGARRRAALLAPILALMVFSVATVQGRATSGALLLGTVLVFAAGARERFQGRPLRWLALASVFAGAFVVAELGPSHGRAESALKRVAKDVSRPDGFLADRRLLWTTSYAMLRDAPWRGAGLGTFHYHFAPRRAYADLSSGTHAHNDYLEIGFEAGAPGLALTLLVGLAALVGFARLQLPGRAPGETRLEAASLLAGLVAVAAHSVFNFNFYQPGIMLCLGLVLGRLQTLVASAGHGGVRMGAAPLAVVWASTLVVVVLAARLGAAAGLMQLATGRGEASSERTDALLERALGFAPEAEAPLFARAYWCLLRSQAQRSAPLDEQRALLARGLDLVERTRRANPFRLDTLQLRSTFVALDPDLPYWRKQEIWIETQRRMLELDPRSLQARLQLVGLLASAGREDEARRVLEEGSAYAHGYGEGDLQYRTALARARLEAGDLDGAAAAASEVDEILFQSGHPPGFLERLQRQLQVE